LSALAARFLIRCVILAAVFASTTMSIRSAGGGSSDAGFALAADLPDARLEGASPAATAFVLRFSFLAPP